MSDASELCAERRKVDAPYAAGARAAERAATPLQRAPEGSGQGRALRGNLWAWAREQLDSDLQWARGLVDSFPVAWADVLLQRWRERRGADHIAANIDHRLRCGHIAKAHRAGVKADASDRELCEVAELTARDTARRIDTRDQITRAELDTPWALPRHVLKAEGDGPDATDRGHPHLSPWSTDWPGRVSLLARYAEALHWLELRGITVKVRGSIDAFLRRVADPRWWRRKLRQMHAAAVESTARAIGLVHKRAGCYVSDDSLKRRQGQRARNEAALERTIAVNEQGQDYTLAELAARSPANRAIRRQELMTRIAGFELIAKDCGHDAYFVTVTCPSRMHAYRTAGVKVEANPKHDGTTPDAAQAYLCQQWGRFGAAMQRWGVELYGFRIAEPNHDGTPHWHALLFMPRTVGQGALKRNPRAGLPVASRLLVRGLRRYFLWNADPRERGAKAHRVKLERIDWNRGSAAGYVAKYVAKNIDGYKVEKDLYGNDTMTSSQRVDAWASTWRIRQFQQVGGAPVGVWRELRRLHPEQADASPVVGMMLDAVNITAGQRSDVEAVDRYNAAQGWAAYCRMQGGHRVPRAALRMRVLCEASGELGRYGEPLPPKPVGVYGLEMVRQRFESLGIILQPFTTRRQVRREVESERCSWIVTSAGGKDAAVQRLQGIPARGEAARPWSPVNNSTRPAPATFGAAVERSPKKGRVHRWQRAESEPGAVQPEEKPLCAPRSTSPPMPRHTSTTRTARSSPLPS